VIGSIWQAWRDNHSDNELSDEQPAALGGLTRAGFLRALTIGTLTAGIGSKLAAAATTAPRHIAPVTDIDKLYDVWQERLNGRDLDGLVDLYTGDVTYVNPDGQLMSGRARVREDFMGMLALKPQIILGNRHHLVYHDIALTTNHWRMTFRNSDGIVQELTGGGIEVLQKQADGGWRYIIDDASRSASR